MSTNKIQIYGGTYDGRTRIIVAAKTKKKAYELMKEVTSTGSYATWVKYTGVGANEQDMANCEENVVYRVSGYGDNKQYERLS